jgi:hypothetical protein
LQDFSDSAGIFAELACCCGCQQHVMATVVQEHDHLLMHEIQHEHMSFYTFVPAGIGWDGDCSGQTRQTL